MDGRNATDWELCAICQASNKEELRCPADSKRPDKGVGYKTLADNIKEFAELGCMPIDLCLSRLDEGDGIEATFTKQKARWHKDCYILFNATKLKRAQKRQSTSQLEVPAAGKYTRSNATALAKETIICFLCESDKLPLHKVSTLGVDARVRECAAVMNDEKLLAKLSCGDLIALEAHYHRHCYTMLCRNAEYSKRDDVPESDKPHRLEGIALAELVSFIEESRGSGGDLSIFKLTDLARMYKHRLEQLGVESTTRVNTTRLKERLVFQVPELESYNEVHGAYLAFRENIGQALTISSIQHLHPSS